MGSKELIICDPEEAYAQALAFYIMGRPGIHFQVQVFTEAEKVKEADILVISETISEKAIARIKARKIFILTEAEESENRIFKYQKGEKILSKILKGCEDIYEEKEVFRTSKKRKKGRIIGVFSPVHRIGKTSYAMKLGEQLSASANVLYISLEVYGGVGGHFQEGAWNLGDLLYYARQEKGNLGVHLTTAVCHKGNLDYILPMPVSEDLKEVTGEEWVSVIKKILRQSIYEVIILDIDEGVRGVYQLLKICSEIHLISDSEEYSQAKIRQFEQEVTTLGYEDILSKIKRKGERKC